MNAIAEFFHMGGYALYVWGSFVVTVLCMVAEPLLLRSQRRDLMRRLARIARMNPEVKA